MRKSPVWVLARKELSILINAPATYVIAVVFLLITGWLFASQLFLLNQSVLDTFFRPLPLIFTFLVPALTMRSFSEEMKSGTIEYLSTLPIEDYEIVLAKYLAALGLLGSLLAFTLFYPVVLFLIGHPDLGQIIGVYISILGLGSFFAAIGLWASAFTRNQVVAFIVGFFVCFIFFLLGHIADLLPGLLASIVRSFSVDTHFDALARGVLDTRDLLYWISGTAFFLAACFMVVQKRFAITNAAGLAMVAIILLLANGLGNWAFFRLDLTQHHAYSLSPASKRLVRELSDPVVVKVYFTPDLPPPYNAYERYVRDLLEEYRAASRGKVRFEFALPTPAAEFEKKASDAGLVPIQFEEMGNDQFQVRRGYMGLVLFYRDKSETLPIVKDIQQLEYDLTSRIAKMTVRTKKSIAITTGHGETSWQTGQPTKFSEDMKDLYDLKEISLSASTTAPIQADVLLVVGPKQKFEERSLWLIDQAIMRGIPALFMVDVKNLMVSQFYVGPLDSGLGDLLQHYGVQLGDRLIYDAQCETIGVTQNMNGFAFSTSIRYPFVPLIDRIAVNNVITRGLDTIGLPFPTTVESVPNLPAGIHFTPLLFTSPKSWLAPAQTYESVSPNNIPTPRPDDPRGPYIVAGLLEGTITSYFQGKPIPIAGQTLVGKSPNTSIVVLGTSHLLDPALPPFTGYDALLSNALAYLSKDETLLGVRSKGEIIRPLKPVSGAVREAVKYGAVLGVAILPILLGLSRWRARQNWRQIITAAFAPKMPA